jgi:predicted amidophosphoribosyltransferase
VKPPRRLCGSCRASLDAPVTWHSLAQIPLCTSSADESKLLAVLRALKDDHRTGLALELASTLSPMVAEAVARFGAPDVFVVPPSPWQSWRRRGFRPVPLILRRLGVGAYPALGRRAFRADQRGLTMDERSANIHGAFYPRRDVRSARVILVDDVVTTGATLLEATRALESAGAVVLCAIAIVRIAPRREK